VSDLFYQIAGFSLIDEARKRHATDETRTHTDENLLLNYVKYFASQGTDTHGQSRDGETPLHGAAREGHIEVVKFLVLKGADVHAKTTGGATPLGYAK